jgi:hypothetical protein
VGADGRGWQVGSERDWEGVGGSMWESVAGGSEWDWKGGRVGEGGWWERWDWDGVDGSGWGMVHGRGWQVE